jgi:hypothetical protein
MDTSDSAAAALLRMAAQRPDLPPALAEAAAAVREGKFTWDELATGKSSHPAACELRSPAARATVWPFLRKVSEEISTEPEPAKPRRPRRPRRASDDDDFSQRTYLRDWDA